MLRDQLAHLYKPALSKGWSWDVSGRAGFERHLEILHAVAETVGRSLDVEVVLRTALDALTHVTGHEISSLHLLSEDGRACTCAATAGSRRSCARSTACCTSATGSSAASPPPARR
jgi:hypothetical protein